ncbi:hypothetical protein PoB_000310400 [Plakobranchus ocellatus]|uniref:Uncharacterized protein n=1 Tax=Plakobranchus ocellatus TaxID=259542 RepID=A0AAV3Y3E9_9GAST|nr:hypothetical protein PoB_000310400 [Plakobranchus ocellatus]
MGALPFSRSETWKSNMCVPKLTSQGAETERYLMLFGLDRWLWALRLFLQVIDRLICSKPPRFNVSLRGEGCEGCPSYVFMYSHRPAEFTARPPRPMGVLNKKSKMVLGCRARSDKVNTAGQKRPCGRKKERFRRIPEAT